MNEISLRKYHRTMGVILALFILLQAVSGLFFTGNFMVRQLTQTKVSDAPKERQERSGLVKTMNFLHFGAGILGGIYRLILGLGLVAMVISGGTIFLKIQARSKK